MGSFLNGHSLHSTCSPTVPLVPRSPPPLASGFAHNSSEKTGSSYPHAYPAAGSAQKRDGKFSVLGFVTSSVDALVKACLVVAPIYHPSPTFLQVVGTSRGRAYHLTHVLFFSQGVLYRRIPTNGRSGRGGETTRTLIHRKRILYLRSQPRRSRPKIPRRRTRRKTWARGCPHACRHTLGKLPRRSPRPPDRAPTIGSRKVRISLLCFAVMEVFQFVSSRTGLVRCLCLAFPFPPCPARSNIEALAASPALFSPRACNMGFLSLCLQAKQGRTRHRGTWATVNMDMTIRQGTRSPRTASQSASTTAIHPIRGTTLSR
jgi:hypothetical protein